jgi:hypothetical protein
MGVNQVEADKTEIRRKLSIINPVEGYCAKMPYLQRCPNARSLEDMLGRTGIEFILGIYAGYMYKECEGCSAKKRVDEALRRL